MTTITWEEFEQVNLRSGTIVKAEEFPVPKNLLIKYGQTSVRKLEFYKPQPK